MYIPKRWKKNEKHKWCRNKTGMSCRCVCVENGTRKIVAFPENTWKILRIFLYSCHKLLQNHQQKSISQVLIEVTLVIEQACVCVTSSNYCWHYLKLKLFCLESIFGGPQGVAKVFMFLIEGAALKVVFRHMLNSL